MLFVYIYIKKRTLTAFEADAYSYMQWNKRSYVIRTVVSRSGVYQLFHYTWKAVFVELEQYLDHDVVGNVTGILLYDTAAYMIIFYFMFLMWNCDNWVLGVNSVDIQVNVYLFINKKIHILLVNLITIFGALVWSRMTFFKYLFVLRNHAIPL